MKALLIALALVLAPAAIVPVAAAEPGPCPDHCTPPEPCGWPPDVRKDPLGYVEFWTDCFS